MESPYGTEEEMKNRAGEGYFVRDPERIWFTVPEGKSSGEKASKKWGDKICQQAGVQGCPYRDKCVNGKETRTGRKRILAKTAWKRKQSGGNRKKRKTQKKKQRNQEKEPEEGKVPF